MSKRQTADDVASRAMECLDRRDVGTAECILEPWLAKEPQHHALRAANALLLLSKDDTEDAIEVALALERDEPTDPQAVNACVHVLQRTCQWDAVVRLYQRLIPVLSQGPNPDLSASENLALTYARMHRYPDMQKACAKLAKESGKLQYTIWGTMANLLSVPEGDANSILLKLASRVVDKQILDAPADSGVKVTPEHCAMYLEALERRLHENDFAGTLLMMLSDGLVETVERCRQRAVYLIGSGPAAAPAAAIYAGETAGHRNVLSFDMGGTSIDIGVIMDAEVPTRTESWAGDERVGIKMVDVHSAGAGGGSIAWIDSLGLLRVGPQSAGSDPGPACYDKGGTSPTTTDADVLLGYVDPDYFLGGEITLDRSRAVEAIRTGVAEPLGMTVTEGAQAILTAVSSFMTDQISEVFTSRGLDVRDIAIVAGGGAGPVHAAFIAELLSIPTVIVPSVAATFSAFGMFAMDIGRNYARSYVTWAEAADLGRITDLFEQMEDEASTGLRDMGAEEGEVEFVRTAAMRYIGQFSEVEVSFPSGEVTAASLSEAVANFHRRHEELYTFQMLWKGTEFLTFYLKATVQKARFELREAKAGTWDAAGAQKSTRECVFAGVVVDTPVYDGNLLRAGNRLEGPAIIEEATTTVVIPSTFTCEVDRQRGYVLTSRTDTGSAGTAEGEGS